MTDNLLRCSTLISAAFAASLFFALPARAAVVPCDFKGISVGDKLTREQVMQRLGIKKFKLDPPRSDFMEIYPQIEKYGITGAAEREDDEIGPYCREDSCNIPFGISVGDDKFPVKAFVSLKDGVVYDIEVSFNTIFWNDVWSIIFKKYGPEWNIEQDTIAVMDYETKKRDHYRPD